MKDPCHTDPTRQICLEDPYYMSHRSYRSYNIIHIIHIIHITQIIQIIQIIHIIHILQIIRSKPATMCVQELCPPDPTRQTLDISFFVWFPFKSGFLLREMLVINVETHAAHCRMTSTIIIVHNVLVDRASKIIRDFLFPERSRR